MKLIPNRSVTTGELINGTFRELAAIKRPLGLYFGFFFAAAFITGFSSALSAVASIPLFIAYFAAQLYLYRQAMGLGGISMDDVGQVFGLLLMAIILAIPLYFSVFLLIVPAVLLGAKWVMAPSYLVAEDRNFIDAIGASWSGSSGNLGSLSLSFFLIWLIWLAFVTLIGSLTGGLQSGFEIIGGLSTSGFGSGVSSLILHALPVMLMGLSVTAYKALNDSSDDLVAIFE
ncbi:MAG: hypothetical protein AAGK17_07115 [Pseudomonadota bacterium]